MGAAAGSRAARRNALSTITNTASATRTRVSADLLVLLAIATLLVIAGSIRREFLGDGVRHLDVILSGRIQLGEPRWLLFPPLASGWIRVWSAVGVVEGVESALRALVALSVISGLLFLASIRMWLRSESIDEARRAAALLLAGSCAPVLVLFSDIAEPQVAAGIATGGLAYARVWRDDDRRAAVAVLCAVGAIAFASLVYQGMILALGMLPLVVSRRTVTRRRAVLAGGAAVLVVITIMIAAQISTATTPLAAAAAVVQGEHNPLTRSMMTTASPWKYLVAVMAGPPQGIVALDNYSGLRALIADVASGNQIAIINVSLMLLGVVVAAMLFISGVRDRQWRVLAAAAIVLALPVIRNQQYGYVKFYILWPIAVALLAIRCRARAVFVTAAIVLAANGCLVAEQIRHGRHHYAVARVAYASATRSTCWLTSGWTPPFAYLWPGSVTPILGTLATGTDPGAQRAALTASLQHCFCDADRVWTDTTSRDAENVTSIARHFGYQGIDLPSVLIAAAEANGNRVPSVWVYSDSARQRACRALR